MAKKTYRHNRVKLSEQLDFLTHAVVLIRDRVYDMSPRDVEEQLDELQADMNRLFTDLVGETKPTATTPTNWTLVDPQWGQKRTTKSHQGTYNKPKKK